MTDPSTAPECCLEVRTVDVGDLVLDPRNARKHGKRNLDAIKGSLSQFGQRRALVVMPDLTVIAGNGTLEAARALGWERIAVTVVPADWTAEQAAAYAIADNRTAELAEWDGDVLFEHLSELDAAGWDLNSLGFDGLPALDSADGDDDVPDAPAEAITCPGDVWMLGPHRITCGSSTDAHVVAALFGDALADAVVTDPPYGVAYESRGRKQAHRAIANDAAKDAELAELVTDSLGLAWCYSSDGAPCYVFHADMKRAVFEASFIAAGFFMHQTLVWVKDALVLGRRDYQSLFEPILYGWKPGGSHSWYGGRKRTDVVGDQQPDFGAMTHPELVAILEDLYRTSDVIRHDRPRRSDEHPTMKPVGLISRLIVNSTKKGQLVYDPFLGSGTTLIAAERQGRVCYGVELDPLYCDVICERYRKLTGKEPIREHRG